MSKTTDILVLGCSNSVGHELCDSLRPDYWNDILEMKDPYNEWWSSENTPKRVAHFYEECEHREQDWVYNIKNSWPYILSDTFNVISAAAAGTGISYIKTLYDLKNYKVGGFDPWLNKATESIIHYNMKNSTDTLNLDHLNGKTPHYVDRFVSTKVYQHLYKTLGNKADLYRNDKPRMVNINDFNEPEEHIWSWKGRNFQELVDNVEILIWQITNEPRICISHPSLDAFVWDSNHTRVFNEKMKSTFKASADYWIDLHPTLSEQEKQKAKLAWDIEIKNMYNNLLNNLDLSQIMNDNIHFVNSVITKRKLKGKKTILLYLDELHKTRYSFDERIFQEVLYEKVTIDTSFSKNPDDIYNLIKENRFPLQKYGHISHYTHTEIASKIKKLLCRQQ